MTEKTVKLIKVFYDEKGIWSDKINAIKTNRSYKYNSEFRSHILNVDMLGKLEVSNSSTNTYVKGYCLEENFVTFAVEAKNKYLEQLEKNANYLESMANKLREIKKNIESKTV